MEELSRTRTKFDPSRARSHIAEFQLPIQKIEDFVAANSNGRFVTDEIIKMLCQLRSTVRKKHVEGAGGLSDVEDLSDTDSDAEEDESTDEVPTVPTWSFAKEIAAIVAAPETRVHSMDEEKLAWIQMQVALMECWICMQELENTRHRKALEHDTSLVQDHNRGGLFMRLYDTLQSRNQHPCCCCCAAVPKFGLTEQKSDLDRGEIAERLISRLDFLLELAKIYTMWFVHDVEDFDKNYEAVHSWICTDTATDLEVLGATDDHRWIQAISEMCSHSSEIYHSFYGLFLEISCIRMHLQAHKDDDLEVFDHMKVKYDTALAPLKEKHNKASELFSSRYSCLHIPDGGYFSMIVKGVISTFQGVFGTWKGND